MMMAVVVMMIINVLLNNDIVCFSFCSIVKHDIHRNGVQEDENRSQFALSHPQKQPKVSCGICISIYLRSG